MLVAALLPDPSLVRLVEAVKDLRGVVIRATDWGHIDQLLQKRPVSMAIIDPMVGKTMQATEVIKLLNRYPAIPTIAYTHLNADGVRALAILGRNGLREVILFQYDDGRLRLARALAQVLAFGIVSRIRLGIRDRLAALPIEIAQAVDDLFERPYLYASANDLVLVSKWGKASVHRCFQRAGLAPPKRVFIAARVAHTASHLRNPGARVQDVASKLGYRDPDILARHTMLALGIRPHALRLASQPWRRCPRKRSCRACYAGCNRCNTRDSQQAIPAGRGRSRYL